MVRSIPSFAIYSSRFRICPLSFMVTWFSVSFMKITSGSASPPASMTVTLFAYSSEGASIYSTSTSGYFSMNAFVTEVN